MSLNTELYWFGKIIIENLNFERAFQVLSFEKNKKRFIFNKFWIISLNNKTHASFIYLFKAS